MLGLHPRGSLSNGQVDAASPRAECLLTEVPNWLSRPRSSPTHPAFHRTRLITIESNSVHDWSRPIFLKA